MKIILQIVKIIQWLNILPFSIGNGFKKFAYQRIKRIMISANLL